VRERIQGIADQVKPDREKKWLLNRLKYADEPNLADRIFQTFSTLPIDLETKRLRKFATQCAKNRNDLAHFGGVRAGKTYQKFLNEIDAQFDALSALYHVLLLHEIQVADEVSRRWIYDGINSSLIKRNFVDVGLLNESALKRKRK
jgi:hypothetical protein